MSIYSDLAATLLDVETVMRIVGHWDAAPPSTEALSSEQPFAVDTLEFYQWLQFIFIPRLRCLIDGQHDLPKQCGIAPMAEEYYRDRQLPVSALLVALGRIDALLSGQS